MKEERKTRDGDAEDVDTKQVIKERTEKETRKEGVQIVFFFVDDGVVGLPAR